MSLPSYDGFISPLLGFLATQREPIRAKEVYAGVAALIGLTAEQKAEMLPSTRQAVYINRIGWAQDALKRSLLSSAPTFGRWLLTDKGRRLAAANPTGLPADEIDKIANASRNTPLKLITEAPRTANDLEIPEDPNRQSPEEQIAAGLKALKQSVAQDLLEYITQSTFKFFELLVLDLLFSMGYGESRAALQHTGKSNDGGIDGIISLDKLGLQKVYVQAKKWTDKVGAPEIQTFVGAMQLRGADRGVLINHRKSLRGCSAG